MVRGRFEIPVYFYCIIIEVYKYKIHVDGEWSEKKDVSLKRAVLRYAVW